MSALVCVSYHVGGEQEEGKGVCMHMYCVFVCVCVVCVVCVMCV